MKKRTFPQGFATVQGAAPGETLRVLDVGSGAISSLPQEADGRPVELVLTDPLADLFAALLDEHGYDTPRPLKVKGEDLDSAFPAESFHVVNCSNALDHCEDPAKVFSGMWRLCKPGGLVVIVSAENEGERRGYSGLHHWNLEPDDEHLWLWSGSFRKDLLDGLHCRYRWRRTDFDMFDARIRRLR